MIYIFDDKAGDNFLSIRGETYKYLVKVRRHQKGDIVNFRDKENIDTLHSYKIIDIEARVLKLELVSSTLSKIEASKKLHIGWCVIDPKSVEKVLASLNEIGVDKISFIYCDRSQKNFKVDLKRYTRIIEASNQQCGRSSMMKFQIYKNIKDFIADYKDVKVFDFCDKVLDDNVDIKDILIGCEGGFSPNEKEILTKQEVFRLDTPLVLRSETAAFSVSSKVLI